MVRSIVPRPAISCAQVERVVVAFEPHYTWKLEGVSTLRKSTRLGLCYNELV